jgi:hypothetical protein
METEAYTLDFGSKVMYQQIQYGGSRHFEKKTKTAITQRIFLWFEYSLTSRFVTSRLSQKFKNAKPEVTECFQDGRHRHVGNLRQAIK